MRVRMDLDRISPWLVVVPLRDDHGRPQPDFRPVTEEGVCVARCADFRVASAVVGFGGRGGIRTHEWFPIAGFQDRCLQPLGHSSVLSNVTALLAPAMPV